MGENFATCDLRFVAVKGRGRERAPLGAHVAHASKILRPIIYVHVA